MGCAPSPTALCWPAVHHGCGGPFGGIVGLGLLVLWVWTLIDVLTKETDENNQRLVWGLVVGFTYAVGAIIYLIVRRPERIKKLGR